MKRKTIGYTRIRRIYWTVTAGRAQRQVLSFREAVRAAVGLLQYWPGPAEIRCVKQITV